jgi:hypothetical protein
MNDYYAVEPKGFGSADKLKMLLGKFGVYQGRFISSYPSNWESLVRQSVEDWTDLEKRRVIRILEKLKQNSGLIRNSELNYKSNISWVDNLLANKNSKNSFPFVGAVVQDESSNSFFSCFEDFDPVGADGELMVASPENFSRVSEVLLMVSQEVYLIDPYLDIGKTDIQSVVSGLLDTAKKGRCKRFIIFASKAFVSSSVDDLKNSAGRILNNHRGPVVEIVINLCHDRGSEGQLHARYLLSKHGALRFDQGFRRLRRKVDVSIVAQRSHDELVDQFIGGELSFDFESVAVSLKK